MKKSAVIVLFAIQYLVFGLNTGFSQWNPICAENPSMNHKAVLFLDDTTGFVVGGTSDTVSGTFPGYVLRTFNGGQSWDTTYLSNNTLFECVHFPSRDTGYVAGWGGLIYKTIDGGDTWINLPQPFGTSIIWMSTYFVNNNVGYFCCANQGPAIIMKTIDGGQSWIDLDSTANNLGAWDITFPNSNFGITNNGFITQDAGYSWNLSNIPMRTYISVTSSSITNIYLVGFGNNGPNGNYGSIAKSSDGGQTWSNQDYYNTHMLYDIDFPSSNIGYAVGDATLYDQIDILATRDGGITWWPQQVNYPTISQLLTSVSAPSDSVAYAVSPIGSIYKTTNGGGLLLGMNDYNNDYTTVNVFPNPASDNIFFQIAETNHTGEIIVKDQLGREVKKQKLNGEKQIEISIVDLSDGMYFYQYVEKGERKTSGKFIVKR